MAKNKICIFLASSITELPKERDELELFIRRVSDLFEDRYDTKILPLRCENVDPAMAQGRKQEEYNEMIQKSEMCLFIFFREVGQYTQEEFEVARKHFEQTGKPKIYTYFKDLPSGEGFSESIRSFMQMLDKQFSHYYTVFDHIDTVKLRILLNLKLQEMKYVQVSFKEGICLLDGIEVLDTANVSEFAHNKLLHRYQEEYARIDERYLQMLPIQVKGGFDESFSNEYARVSARRLKLQETIETLQKRIFELSLNMCQNDVGGEITRRQREAYRLFELGDYDGCMAVLNIEDIDVEFQRDEQRREEEGKRMATRYIREHQTAIDIIETSGDWMNDFDGCNLAIEERYEKILPVAEKYGVEQFLIGCYASHLVDCGHYERAYEVAHKLEALCRHSSNWNDMVYLAGCYGIVARSYEELPDHRDEAERCFLAEVELVDTISQSNLEWLVKEEFPPVDCYDSFGLYILIHKKDLCRAKEYLLKGIELLKRLATIDFPAFWPYLCLTYSHILSCADDINDEGYWLNEMHKASNQLREHWELIKRGRRGETAGTVGTTQRTDPAE